MDSLPPHCDLKPDPTRQISIKRQGFSTFLFRLPAQYPAPIALMFLRIFESRFGYMELWISLSAGFHQVPL